MRIGNTQGELIESSLLVVKIKTFQNIEVTIPNSIVLGGQHSTLAVIATKMACVTAQSRAWF